MHVLQASKLKSYNIIIYSIGTDMLIMGHQLNAVGVQDALSDRDYVSYL